MLKRFRDIRLICRKATGAVHAQDCESHCHNASDLAQEQHNLMVVKLWLGENAIEVSRVAGLLFCVYNLVYMWMMLNYNFACGMGRTKVISIWLTVAGAGNLLLTMWGCSVYRSWITVVVATAVAAIPCAFFVQKDKYSTAGK